MKGQREKRIKNTLRSDRRLREETSPGPYQGQTKLQPPRREPRRRLHPQLGKMRKFILSLILLLGAVGAYSQSVSQQLPNKEALLIANGDYAHFGRLPNPVNDARLLAQSLQKVGFQVTLLENQSREGMLDALNAFQDRLKATRGIAFFHYGGHGVQVSGRNYLIPVDADIPDERKVATRAVDLEEVMTTLDASGSHVNVVVLDACRDNPLPATSSRSASRGLSVVHTKPKNSLIVYAAEPGSKAEDGLFTPTLAEVITTPGKSLSQIFKGVRRQVFQKSNGNQTPGEYDQLFEDVYLAGGSSAIPPSPQEVAEPATISLSASEQQTHPAAPSFPLKTVEASSSISNNQNGSVGPTHGLQCSTIESVIRSYLNAIEKRDPGTVLNSLADTVDYYSLGLVSKSKAMDDISRDWNRYSNYRSSVSDFVQTGPTTCQLIYEYFLMQGMRQKRGKLLMNVALTGGRNPKIISIKAKVLSAR